MKNKLFELQSPFRHFGLALQANWPTSLIVRNSSKLDNIDGILVNEVFPAPLGSNPGTALLVKGVN